MLFGYLRPEAQGFRPPLNPVSKPLYSGGQTWTDDSGQGFFLSLFFAIASEICQMLFPGVTLSPFDNLLLDLKPK